MTKSLEERIEALERRIEALENPPVVVDIEGQGQLSIDQSFPTLEELEALLTGDPSLPDHMRIDPMLFVPQPVDPQGEIDEPTTGLQE